MLVWQLVKCQPIADSGWENEKNALHYLQTIKKKTISGDSDTLMRNLLAPACDADSYLIIVLWVGTSENASRSAKPRLDVLPVPFLLTNKKKKKKKEFVLYACCLKTSNMITDLWKVQ